MGSLDEAQVELERALHDEGEALAEEESVMLTLHRLKQGAGFVEDATLAHARHVPIGSKEGLPGKRVNLRVE